MSTLQNLLDVLAAKPGFIRIIEKSRTVLTGSTDTEIVYDLFYLASGTIRQAKICIVVFGIGTDEEAAYYRNSAPSIATDATTFTARLLVAMNAATTGLVKRIVAEEIYDDRTCAVIKVYIADATNPTKITMTRRFVYDDAGTLKHYPYVVG